MRTASKYALVGVGFSAMGWALGAVAFAAGQFWIFPVADVTLGLGIILAMAGLVKAGNPLSVMIVVGIIYGIGFFYKGQDHETHILSGIGFGLPHEAHTLIGLVLIAAATGIAAALSFRQRKEVISTL